jgi:hypothetical protein
VARRLLIAFIVLGLVSAALWLMPRGWGLLSLRWWVPLLGFLIVLFGVVVPALSQAPRQKEKTLEEQINTPDPGPSPEDLKRFGDPWLKLTDREE